MGKRKKNTTFGTRGERGGEGKLCLAMTEKPGWRVDIVNGKVFANNYNTTLLLRVKSVKLSR